MKKILKLTYNWFFTPEGEANDTVEVGKPEYTTKKIITEINEHCAMGESDKWYYDIHFEDGTLKRIFNPNQVFYSK